MKGKLRRGRREFTFIPEEVSVIVPQPDNFARALKVVRRWEGGLVDHPSDPGGITKWGISLRFLRAIKIDINGDGVIDGKDIRSLTEDQVTMLYRHHFWSKCLCDFLPTGIDLAVFDCGVNQGPTRAKKLLQKALKVKVDGKIGPITLAAADKADPSDLLCEFMVRRAVHYSSLMNVIVFGLGWFRRLFDVYRCALTALTVLSICRHELAREEKLKEIFGD